MTLTTKKLSWKPRRKGDVYCSPACGHGCTWEEYTAAKRTGLKMLTSMRKPSAWRVHVWENLGWHVIIEHVKSNGRLSVCVSHSNNKNECRYYAMLSFSHARSSDARWPDLDSPTPQRAVDQILKAARRVVKRECDSLEMFI